MRLALIPIRHRIKIVRAMIRVPVLDRRLHRLRKRDRRIEVESISRRPRAGVLVANHSSHLDTVSLLALFPLGRLKEIRPELLILLATGYSDAAVNVRGHFPILRKPYEIHQLSDAIAKLPRQ